MSDFPLLAGKKPEFSHRGSDYKDWLFSHHMVPFSALMEL